MKIFDLIRQLSKFPANSEVYGFYKGKRGKLEGIEFIEVNNFTELLFGDDGYTIVRNVLNEERAK